MEKGQQMAGTRWGEHAWGLALRWDTEGSSGQRPRTCAHVCICVLCVVWVMVFVLWYAAMSGGVRLVSLQAWCGTLEWV